MEKKLFKITRSTLSFSTGDTPVLLSCGFLLPMILYVVPSRPLLIEIKASPYSQLLFPTTNWEFTFEYRLFDKGKTQVRSMKIFLQKFLLNYICTSTLHTVW